MRYASGGHRETNTMNWWHVIIMDANRNSNIKSKGLFDEHPGERYCTSIQQSKLLFSSLSIRPVLLNFHVLITISMYHCKKSMTP